nr:hypothetical protein [Anthocerotibacter panamensis]
MNPQQTSSLVDILRHRAHHQPDRIAFIFLQQYGGSRKGTLIRVVFQNLLHECCEGHNLLLIPKL